MAIFWQKDKNPNLITERLESIKKEGKDGKYNFTGFDFTIYSTLLYNILCFPPEVSEIDARELITKSIFATVKKKDVTPKNLLFEINRNYENFLSLPQNRYVLVSSISISKFTKFNRIHIGNDRIIFENYLSKKFDTISREKTIEKAINLTCSKFPTDYSYVRIFVSSRSKNDAGIKALNNINFIRGIWNWILNGSPSFRKTFIGDPKPVNRIVLGPIHTLHNYDGKQMDGDEWWYEPNYLGPIKPFKPDEGLLQKLQDSQIRIRRKIKKLKYADDLRDALIRYSIALDDRDMFSAYLQLWGVLEFLTGSSKYNNLEKRVSSLYKSRDYHRQVLKILKEFRNSYVHAGKESNEIESYLFHLKNYVNLIIHFHITNTFHFDSINDFAEFLDLPSSEKEFKYKLKLYNYAKRIRNY